MLPDRHVDLGDGGILRNRATGTVVQDVEAPVPSDALSDGVFDALLLGHVCFDKYRLAADLTDVQLARASEFGLELSYHDLGAFVRKQPRGGPRDPRSGASNKGYSSL